MTPQQKYLNIVDEVIEKGPFKPDWVSLSDYETPKPNFVCSPKVSL